MNKEHIINVVRKNVLDLSKLSKAERNNLFLEFKNNYKEINAQIWDNFEEQLENYLYEENLEKQSNILDINITFMFSVMKTYNTNQFFISVIREIASDKSLNILKKKYSSLEKSTSGRDKSTHSMDASAIGAGVGEAVNIFDYIEQTDKSPNDNPVCTILTSNEPETLNQFQEENKQNELFDSYNTLFTNIGDIAAESADTADDSNISISDNSENTSENTSENAVENTFETAAETAAETAVENVVGGAFKKYKTIIKERQKKELGVWLTIGHPNLTVSVNYIPYMMASNDEYKLIGFILNNYYVNYPVSINDYLLMGLYSDKDLYGTIKEYKISDIQDVPLKILFEKADPRFDVIEESKQESVIMSIYNYFIESVKKKVFLGFDTLIYSNKLIDKLKNRFKKYSRISAKSEKSEKLEKSEKSEKTDSTSKSITRYEKLLDFRTDNEFESSKYADLIISNAYYTYLLSQRGADIEEVKQFFELKESEKRHKRMLADFNKERLISYSKQMDILYFIKTKLGTKRYDEIYHLHKINSNTDIFEFLTSTEKNQIKLDYKKYQEYLEMYSKNKCEHIKLYRELKQDRNIHDLKTNLDNLLKLSKREEDKKMIECKHCHFGLICPHELVLYKMQLDRTSYNDIKVILNKYIENAIDNNYYCNICGELIQTRTETIEFSNIMEDTFKLLRGETMRIIELFTTKVLINPFRLSDSIIDAIIEPINGIDEQINRSKTNTAEEIKAKLRLYIMIYAFVYLCRMMVDKNAQNLDLKFKNGKKFSKLAEALNYTATLILNRGNAILNVLKGVSTSFIKEIMISANSYLNSREQKMDLVDPKINIVMNLLVDPVIHYLAIDYYMKHNLKSKYLLNSEMLIKILGLKTPKDFDKIEKTGIYANVVFPHYKTDFDITKNIHLTFENYYDASVSIFFEKIRTNLYQNYFYSGFIEEDTTTGEIFSGIKITANVEKYIKSCDNLKQKEVELFRITKLPFIPAYGKYKSIYNLNYQPIMVPMNMIYDIDGKLHNWNIFIVSMEENGKQVQREIKKTGNKDNLFGNIKIKDTKCSVCEQLYSKIDPKLDEQISKKIYKNNSFNGFFQFYEKRCPLGGLHNFVNDKCSKCNLADNINKNEYYDKYHKNYMEDLEKINKIDFNVVYDSHEYVYKNKWSYDTVPIVELANLLKINVNLLLNLGDYENINLVNVINGTYTAKKNTLHFSTRSNIINTYVRNLIIEYNNMRYYSSCKSYLSKDRIEEIDKIFATSKIEVFKITTLSELPNITNEYFDKYEWFIKNETPDNVVNFCLSSLVEKALSVYKTKNPVCPAFISYYFQKILKFEELKTKAVKINWDEVREYNKLHKASKDTNFNDVDTPTDAADDTDSEDDEIEDPLNTDALDVEDDILEDNDVATVD